jgi:lipid A 3-O-deacylase
MIIAPDSPKAMCLTLIARSACALGLIVLTPNFALAQARDPDLLSFGLGAFDVTGLDEKQNQATAEAQVEVRFGGKLFSGGEVWRGVGPVLGLMLNADGGAMAYGGAYADFRLGKIVIQPAAALGGYARGGSKDLGGVFEVMSSLLVAYEFDNRRQLGLSLSHISNGGTHSVNPGANSLLLTYSLPLGQIF